MKNIKLISIVCVVVVTLLALRFLVGQLEQQPEGEAPVSKQSNKLPTQTNGVLPVGDWAQTEESETEHQKTITESNLGSAAWQEQVKAFGHDPEKTLLQEQVNQASIEVVEPQTPKQLFPGVADLLNDKLPEGYDEVKRQQNLARFVQSVAPSVEAIEVSLKSLDTYGLSAEKKQAYQQMGKEKIAALQKLKQQALALDAGLLNVVVEPVQ